MTGVQTCALPISIALRKPDGIPLYLPLEPQQRRYRPTILAVHRAHRSLIDHRHLVIPYMNTFWSHCLSQFEKELPNQQFITWIKPLSVKQNGSTGLTVIAPNRFVLQWIRDKFFSRLQSLADEHFGVPISIDLLLMDQAAATNARNVLAPLTPAVSNPPATEPTIPAAASVSRPQLPRDLSRLNPAFTFDSFVTGKANELARAAAAQVAEK